MVLIYPAIIFVWLIALAVLIVLYKKHLIPLRQQKRRTTPSDTQRVAHTDRLTTLPAYVKQLARYRYGIIATLLLLAFCFVITVVLSARPAKQSLVTPSEKNRDIMLCLDVSGSMKSVDTAIVDVYSRLVNNFDGQRIGLDAYNYNNSQVFPLTDDYTLVREQLASVKKSLNYDLYSSSTEGLDAATAFYAGTGYSSDATMSSNVGLGLTGCIQHLGENKSGRSQSIILATDNEIGGVLSSDDISTTQAMLLAKRQGIRVYSLDPGVSDGGLYSSPRADIADNSRGEHATLKTYSLMTGGGYYRLTSTDVTADIIAKISSQEAKLYTGSSQYATTDTPFVWFIVLCLGFIGLIAMSWRLKL